MAWTKWRSRSHFGAASPTVISIEAWRASSRSRTETSGLHRTIRPASAHRGHARERRLRPEEALNAISGNARFPKISPVRCSRRHARECDDARPHRVRHLRKRLHHIRTHRRRRRFAFVRLDCHQHLIVAGHFLQSREYVLDGIVREKCGSSHSRPPIEVEHWAHGRLRVVWPRTSFAAWSSSLVNRAATRPIASCDPCATCARSAAIGPFSILAICEKYARVTSFNCMGKPNLRKSLQRARQMVNRVVRDRT